MPIFASDIKSKMQSALDAEGSDYYSDNQDFIPAINFAVDKVIEWVNFKKGSNKFTEEAIRELKKVQVHLASSLSRVNIPDTIWTIDAVMAGIVPYKVANERVVAGDAVVKQYTYAMDILVGFSAEIKASIGKITLAITGGTTKTFYVHGVADLAAVKTALETQIDDPILIIGNNVIITSASGAVYGIITFVAMEYRWVDVMGGVAPGLLNKVVELDYDGDVESATPASLTLANILAALNGFAIGTFVISGNDIFIKAWYDFENSIPLFGNLRLDPGGLNFKEIVDTDSPFAVTAYSPSVANRGSDYVTSLHLSYLSFDDSTGFPCKRFTDDEWDFARANPVEAAYKRPTTATSDIVSYGYNGIIDFSNNTYPSGLWREITIRPSVANKLIGLKVVIHPTRVAVIGDSVAFPQGLLNLLVETALFFTSFKQGDQTNINGITEKQLIQFIQNW